MIPANMKTKFMGMYRGQVFDNADPLKQGRIKVQIWPMMSEITNPELLPWAVPAMPLWGGAGSGFGMMAIPAVGTHVFTFFEAGDVYKPVYFAEAQNATAGIPAETVTHYPFTRVLKSPSGVTISVDDAQGSIKIETPLHSILQIDQTGKMTFLSVAGIDLVALVNLVISVGGLISITAPAGVTVEAPVFNVSGNLEAGSGATGTFTSSEGRTITVIKGIVMGIT